MADLMVTLSCGLRMCVPDSVDLMTPYVLLEQEDWFEDETGFVRKLLRPGDRVLEVGSPHWVYALQAALRVGEAGHVWALEPGAGASIEESVALNGFTNVAVVRGRAGLDLEDLALVKLDANSVGLPILEGSASLFERQSPLVLFGRRSPLGPEVGAALAQQFAGLGYGLYRLVPGPSVLVPFEGAAPSEGDPLNLFACKPDRAALLEGRGLLAQSTDDPGDPPAVWRRLLAALAYTDRMSDDWIEDQPGWTEYSRVLDRAIMAGDVGYPVRERAGHLAAAYTESARLCSQADQPARLMTHARLAWAWGQRQEAVEVLDRLEGLLSATTPPRLIEPFVVACPRFEQVDPLDRTAAWCLAAVLEQRERLRHYSSYFTGLSTLPDLDRHASLGFPGTEIERRRHLIRLRHDRPPAPCGLLAAAGPGHNNPEFFSR